VKDKRFVFAGNRFFVLEEMLRAGLNVVKVLAVSGSYLEKELTNRGLPYQVIKDKKFLIEELMKADFDIFLSNGLPYILPVEKLKAGNTRQFTNIHPSYLPDLRGADPVPGALLYGRDSGATCHHMSDTVDGGDIIAQVKISYSENLDSALLYQLSFKAEKEVFLKALEQNFSGNTPQFLEPEHVYYTFKDSDLRIDFSKSIGDIFRQVRAFNTPNKGAYFQAAGETYKVFDAEMISNDYFSSAFSQAKENEIVLTYMDTIVIRKGNMYLKLKKISGQVTGLKPGVVLA
jgi:methionyl-tRNA formyltransferase